MSNKNLFKEAIADAKAVREAALANAKAALEEALTPKLQSMLAAKLNEMEYEEEEELEEMGKMKDEEEMEEGFNLPHVNDNNPDFNLEEKYEEEEELEEDFDLSEILAELNDEEEELEEGKKKEEMEEGKKEEEEEEEDGEEEVADMTVEDLKALIKDLIAQEMEDEMPADDMGAEEEAGETVDMGGGDTDSDEIDLEELLAELDSLEEGDKEEELEEAKKKKSKKEELEEVDLGKIGAGVKRFFTGDKECAAEAEKADSSKPGAYSGPTAVAKSNEWWAAFNACRKAKGRTPITTHKSGQAFGVKETKEELEEAIDTINTLRAELNEVNLLNAKLLYVNKIFKAKNLTESQKLQVIASFDKATTAKEAKVVFESLNATLTANTAKKQIKESLGFASKAAGVAPKKAIVESNDVITRMQKLANIIK